MAWLRIGLANLVCIFLCRLVCTAVGPASFLNICTTDRMVSRAVLQSTKHLCLSVQVRLAFIYLHSCPTHGTPILLRDEISCFSYPKFATFGKQVDIAFFPPQRIRAYTPWQPILSCWTISSNMFGMCFRQASWPCIADHCAYLCIKIKKCNYIIWRVYKEYIKHHEK